MDLVSQKIKSNSKKYRKVGPYLLGDVIGKGSYSVVYAARKEGDKKKYAVKQISLLNVKPKQLQRVHLQISVLTHIKHQNIVSLLDYKQTSRNLYLVFEYCKNTDLDAFVQKYCLQALPEEKVKKIAIQMKNAFQVLRAKKVVHRDLKLANVLVTQDFQIKIADFGFAKYLDDDEFFKSYVGTPLTMAPEIMENMSYNEKCDLWSLGIMIYQLLFGKNPFFTKEKMTKQDIRKAIRSELIIPDSVSDLAKDLLKKLIVREPSKRISFDDFFRHPWLSNETVHTDLNQDLLQDALRSQLNKVLMMSNKKKQEKQFLMKKAENLLSFQIIENVKNTIEGKIMYWVNLGKKIMSIEYPNKKLSFLSIALLMQNLQKCQACPYYLTVNEQKRIQFPKYENIRKMQKWEMSEYTKRLPGFIGRTWVKMSEFIKSMSIHAAQFGKNQLVSTIQQLFLLELTSELVRQIENKELHEYLSLFIKVKPFLNSQLNARISSPVFDDNIVSMLLRKTSQQIQNDKMYKRCAGVFKFETLHKDYPEDRIFQNLKQLLE